MDDALPIHPAPDDAELLKACGDCLTDLAALRDRDLVLTAIVKRARALLRADMAYMSSNDLGAGETFIHHTDGVRTREYASIRMPLGSGVLGAVAAGGDVVQTHGYLRDDQLNHISRIDDIVRLEGVETIVGWPMRVGGRVIGALMAAHRTSVVFGPESVRALELMARHAAIALEQSRLWAELAGAAAAPGASELSALLDVDDMLLGALVSDEGLGAITSVLGDATGARVAVCDPAGRLLAGRLPKGLDLDSGEAAAVVSSSIHGAQPARHSFGDLDVVIAAVTARGEHLGTLVLHGDAVAGMDLRAVSRAAVHVSALLLFERNLAEAGFREQGVLFDDLIAGRPDALRSVRRTAFGLASPSACSVSVYRVERGRRPQVMAAVREALDGKGLVTQHGGEVCVLTAVAPEELFERVRRRGVRADVGVAAVGAEWSALAAAHEQAHQVAATLVSLGRAGTMARAADLGIAGLVMSGVDEGLVESIVRARIGALVDWDEAHGTDLCATALAFLESDSLAECAAGMHLHVNTVRQRLARIDKILGPDWRSGRERGDSLLALRVRALRPTNPGAGAVG